MCWDVQPMLDFVFLTYSTNFRQHLSKNNVHVAWLFNPFLSPFPHQTMLRGATSKLTTSHLSTLYRGEGIKFKNDHYIVATHFSIIVAQHQRQCYRGDGDCLEATLKVLIKVEKKKKRKYRGFSCKKIIKISYFLASSARKYMLCKDLYHHFCIKKPFQGALKIWKWQI